jgi:Carbohydrate family 9 binding domain-like
MAFDVTEAPFLASYHTDIMPMKFLFTLPFILITVIAFSQPPVKKLVAVKTNTPPKIDGILDDEVWKNVPVATDFIENQPVAGRHEKTEDRTEIKIIYDNTAIYIAARMYESDPNKIARELTTRDSIANDDFIGIIFDTYHDGLNGSGFYTTAAGTQYDAKYAPNPNGNIEDATWNAVWESKVKLDSQGWTAEFKIPYSALRFAKKDVQYWGLNIVRRRRTENKQLFWNEIDPKKNGLMNQEGDLSGIEKITPPVRLAFYPYFSTYVKSLSL